jgi:hypothetical protein
MPIDKESRRASHDLRRASERIDSLRQATTRRRPRRHAPPRAAAPHLRRRVRIEAYLDRTGGRFTDEIERRITMRLISGDWHR